MPAWGYSILIVMAIGYAIMSLLTGLFLIDKMQPLPSWKRVAIIGVIVPLGAFLTFAWGIIPLIAYKHSMGMLVAVMFALIPTAAALHFLSQWVCRSPAEL